MASSSEEAGQKSFWPILIGALASTLTGLVYIYFERVSMIDPAVASPTTFVLQDIITDKHFREVFIFVIPFQILLGAFIGKIARESAKTKRRAILGASIFGGIIGLALGSCGLYLWLVGSLAGL